MDFAAQQGEPFCIFRVEKYGKRVKVWGGREREDSVYYNIYYKK